MSRLSRFLLLFVLIVFTLACNLVTQPIDDVQNLAGTAESIASSMPNVATTLESAATSIPFEDFDFTNPQGTPLSEWNGIPVMPQATVGQEFNEFTYSFKVPSTPPDVQSFYKTELANLGWSSSIDLPVGDEGGFMLYTKDDNILAITITSSDGGAAVVLTLE